MNKLWVLISILFALVGCSRQAEMPSPDPNVRSVARNEPQMARAIADARASFGTFKEFLANPPKGSHLAVKVRMTGPDGDVEHIWLSDVSVSGGRIRGKLDNDPVYLDKKAGDPVDLPESDLSDWAIWDHQDELVMGGFTIKLLNQK